MPTRRTSPLFSTLESLHELSEDERAEILAELDREELLALSEAASDWHRPTSIGGARPNQIEPDGDWFVWLCRAGRGWGKTRTGAEFVRERVDSGAWRRVHLVAATGFDLRHTMVEGESGLLNCWPAHQRPIWEPSKRLLTCHTGAKLLGFSAEEPERFRGPQCDGAWADEIDAWRPKGMKPSEAWALFELGVRLGPDPRICATSTPKRAKLVAELIARSDVVQTQGSMYENEENLAPAFVRMVRDRYEGTHLARQEIHGEILRSVEGALVTEEMIEERRARSLEELQVARIVVGVDPSGTSGPEGSSQGIVAAATDLGRGELFVLSDSSAHLKPKGWGERAVHLAAELRADCIAVETNFGGEMAEEVILAAAERLGVHVRVVKVTASRGKHVRFEPLALLYEQRRVRHLGAHPVLEDQVCGFTAEGYGGDESPDRADALVWAAFELMRFDRRGSTWGDLYRAGAKKGRDADAAR